MPTVAITDLDPIEIPHHFNLTHCPPTEFELSPRETEKVSLPPHLNSILADYDMATGGSPKTETLIRSRINVIILTTLAKMKREFAAKPRPSASSIPLKSIHLKFKRKMKFDWKSDNRLVRLSGIVNYSLSYGIPNKYATNMVMMEARRPHLLKSGMLHCLAYMAMIHETRKQSRIRDTSVYGVATDSYQWVFIRIRPNGEWSEKTYSWVHSAQDIVSMLVIIFAHAAGFDPQTGYKRGYSASLQSRLSRSQSNDVRNPPTDDIVI
ncbi:hypothetical protein N7491_006870 [Penicillium cf. griseofulvum]|uniref:Uncharacterized protein n=1 Tax=Penicillium cf. griseofulvum TaxID=2972120 RepID=A0A9W9M148_9EURO|nr:hypothetical protein N7472_010100 [Penicillium cf. griseofulvum]KAJ5429854.1 hypothetical protein N7491_006870 [Penicillium cf. griseofulvum]KAJ5436376.1 hypothetical protein N7445_007261 [Penicillium cf. griseofulvum]